MAHVLSPTIPQASLLAFARGLVDVARAYPTASEAALPRGLVEVDELDGLAGDLDAAERTFRAEQSDEAAAAADAEAAMDALDGFYSALRGKISLLVRQEPDARRLLRQSVLQRVPAVDRVTQDSRPGAVRTLVQACCEDEVAAWLGTSGWPPSRVRAGEALADAAERALARVGREAGERTVASVRRDGATEALYRKAHRVDDYLESELPEDGRTRLAALRVAHLPVRSDAKDAPDDGAQVEEGSES